MKKITIVDENDNVIGAAEMSEARQKGWIHRLAHLLVTNSENNILLQKRSERMLDSPGKWDFSAAGHVDEGETYRQAAIREAEEELGLHDLLLIPLLKNYTQGERNGNQIRRFHMVFGTQTDQDVHIDATEVAEVKWFTPEYINTWIIERPEDFTRSFVGSYPKTSLSRVQ